MKLDLNPHVSQMSWNCLASAPVLNPLLINPLRLLANKSGPLMALSIWRNWRRVQCIQACAAFVTFTESRLRRKLPVSLTHLPCLVSFIVNIQEWHHFAIDQITLLVGFLLLQISCTFAVLHVAHITSPQIVCAHSTTALSKNATFEDVAAVIFAVCMDICVGCSNW